LEEIEAAYPGLAQQAASHPGVGFVIALSSVAREDDDGAARGSQVAWMIGPAGRRNLSSGRVEGEDPLVPFAADELELEKRAAQLARLASFPHSGDLILGSTLYEDGTVAAFEELVGNHGGLGGLQTEAFILHPGDMEVPDTANATDVFPLVNGRRGTAAPDVVPPCPTPR
jgi:hypothetical protein